MDSEHWSCLEVSVVAHEVVPTRSQNDEQGCNDIQPGNVCMVSSKESITHWYVLAYCPLDDLLHIDIRLIYFPVKSYHIIVCLMPGRT